MTTTNMFLNFGGKWDWNWNHKNLNTYLSCHNFFSPFFCSDTFDTSLLLIVCALKWYIKSLYRHLFLDNISTHARVTKKKKHFLICGKLYSQAPWPQRPKLGVRVAKGFSCDRMDSLFPPSEPPPPPRDIVLKRGGPRILRGRTPNIRGPASSLHYFSGGGGGGEVNP